MVRRQHGHALGHLGHCFLGDPNDPKAGTGARFGFLALGHLGHLVIDLKSARDAACLTRAWFYRY
jgi:hypothetical protein